MDPRERLRLALLSVGCSRCGQPYEADGVNVLAQREGIAFVQLECAACATRILALVTGSPEADDEVRRAEWTAGSTERGNGRHDRDEVAADDLTGTASEGHAPGERGRRAEARAIDEADVEEMRRFLAGYEGDLRGLFQAVRDDESEDA